MATPIAHKGIYYGSKVVALTVLDFLTRPELVAQAWDYFNNVQTKNTKYVSFIRPGDKPAIWLNEQIMAKYRPEMKYYRSVQSTETYPAAWHHIPNGGNNAKAPEAEALHRFVSQRLPSLARSRSFSRNRPRSVWDEAREFAVTPSSIR